MLINKINIPQLTSSFGNKNFAMQNRPLRELKGDTFVKFTGAEQENDNVESTGARDVYAYIDSLKNDPMHPERQDLFNDQLLFGISMVDVLTVLLNKRALFADLEKNIKTAMAQDTGISFAMFDLDYFKSINDLFDHDTGDEFLKIIGEKISAGAKQYGYKAYRYGGEEFVVVMPGANSDTAAKIAKEISANINQDPILQEKKIPKLGDQRYIDAYLINAQGKIVEYQEAQKPFADFKDRLKEYEVKAGVFKELEDKGADVRTMELLEENLTDSMRILKASLQRLLEHALTSAKSRKDKKYLGGKIKSLNSGGGDVKAVYSEDLKNYLNTHFNKDFEIAQTTTWSNHIQKPVNGKLQGFTITAGVKEFSDLKAVTEALPKKTDLPRFLLDGVDHVLKSGKDEDRGRVYAA